MILGCKAEAEEEEEEDAEGGGEVVEEVGENEDRGVEEGEEGRLKKK